MAELTSQKSGINFRSYVWHAGFFALAVNFMDTDTVIPAVLIKSGGGPFAVGILTAIMLGVSRLFQLLFAGLFEPLAYKKKFMILGIFLRIFSLFFLALALYFSAHLTPALLIGMIFFVMTLFSVSGSLANVPYIDILGKSILASDRRKFFSVRQIVNSLGILISAFAVRHVLKGHDFPVNYAISFALASGLLLIASFGFINVREVKSPPKSRDPFFSFLKRIGPELRKYPNLVNYLFILNTTGLAITFTPFMVMMAKDHFGISAGLVGNILLLKVFGMLIPGTLLFFIHKKYSYKWVLMLSVLLGVSLPVLSLVLIHNAAWYQYLFVVSGIFLGLYKIAINGILIEISNEENRTFFAGITGAGNILASLLPIFSGMFIVWFGYKAVFLVLAGLILAGLVFAAKLNCSAVKKK